MKASFFTNFVALILLISLVNGSMAATCDATQLSPCLSAMMSATPPSRACCTKLKSQQPCLCQYMKNPSLKQYINENNAKRVASSCGVTYPNC
ncbi:hypothetical protein ACHQM5_009587 [Ranunculus cassubicifolius]